MERTPKLPFFSPLFRLEDLITRRNSLTSNKDSEIIRTPPIGTEELMEEDKTPQSERHNSRMVASSEPFQEGNRVNKQLNFDNLNLHTHSSDREVLQNQNEYERLGRASQNPEELCSKTQTEMDDSEIDDDKEELLLRQLEQIGSTGKQKHKTFEGVPKQWHQTIRVRNPETSRVKLYFKCKYPGCGSVFKKSCNLRDHFRKHTGLRPFKCPYC